MGLVLLSSEEHWAGSGSREQVMGRDSALIPARGQVSDGKLAQTGGSQVGLAGREASFPLTCSEVSHVRLSICVHARKSCLQSYITPWGQGSQGPKPSRP